MTISTIDKSQRKAARVVGFTYLFAMVTANFAEFYVRSKLIVYDNCEEDLKNFLTTMDALGEKLGPLLFQFGHFKSSTFKSQAEFLARLKPFLK